MLPLVLIKNRLFIVTSDQRNPFFGLESLTEK